MSSVLLSEHNSYDQAHITLEEGESLGGKPKKLYMKGIFIQGDVKNHNGRIYPMSEIRKSVDDINQKIKNGFTICGEADHPKELEINMDRISHMINEMWVDGKNGCGKLQILDSTPMGQLARGLIEDGVKLGVSSRGYGNLDHSGYVNDYTIVTVDLVCNPSAPNSYPVPIWESLNMRRGAVIDDLSRAAVNDPLAQKYLREELLTFISKL